MDSHDSRSIPRPPGRENERNFDESEISEYPPLWSGRNWFEKRDPEDDHNYFVGRHREVDRQDGHVHAMTTFVDNILFIIFWTANASRYQMTLDLAQRETRRQLLVPTPRRPFFGGGLSQSWWFFGLCLVVWSVFVTRWVLYLQLQLLSQRPTKTDVCPMLSFLMKMGRFPQRNVTNCCRIDPVVALAPTATWWKLIGGESCFIRVNKWKRL